MLTYLVFLVRDECKELVVDVGAVASSSTVEDGIWLGRSQGPVRVVGTQISIVAWHSHHDVKLTDVFFL